MEESSSLLHSKQDLATKIEKEKASQVVVHDDDGKNNNITLKDSNDVEITKIRLMRAFVESKDSSSKEIDDLTLRRFLRARELDVEKGSAMFLKYLKWRHSFMPNGFISSSEISDQLGKGITFSQGFDKMGRPICVTFASKYFKGKNTGDGFKRYIVFALDKLCSRIPEGQEKFCIIADIQGWGTANMDLKGHLGILNTIQEFFPERLGMMYFVHAPSLFLKFWKIISAFIDNNTKKKFTFVETKKLKPTLLEDIDEDQLPEIYGGKMALVPIEDY